MKPDIILETGDILHCSRDKFLSRAIRMATDSEVSHTAVVVECWGRVYVVDAQRDGVNARPLEAWLEKYKYDQITVARRIGNFDERAFAVKAFSKIGHTGYDWVTLVFRFPYAIITGKWPLERDPEKHMTCSHFTAWLEGIPDAHLRSPEDMLQYTMARDDEEFVHKKIVNPYAV